MLTEYYSQRQRDIDKEDMRTQLNMHMRIRFKMHDIIMTSYQILYIQHQYTTVPFPLR